MSQLLNSLIVSSGSGTQSTLEKIMANNLDEYELVFSTAPVSGLEEVKQAPHLIFIDNTGGLSDDDVVRIAHRFKGKTCVVLEDHPENHRRQFIKAGIDEVMSIAELESDLGRHLLEKLIALKDLADAEERIEQSEERFRGIIEHAHDIIALLDAEGTIIYTSPAFGRQLSYESWEVLGQSVFDFMHEDDRVIVEDHFLRVVAPAGDTPRQPTTPLEFRMRNNRGEWRDMEAIITNLLTNMTVQAVVFNIRDVTDQKAAEIELEKYRRHLEELVEQRTREAEEANLRAEAVLAASPDTLIAIDEQGFIYFMSRHYYTRYPKSANRLRRGTHILDAFDMMADEVNLSRDDPRYLEMREWWKNPQGTREFRLISGMWARLQAKPMQGIKGTVISSTDISEYKRQQALLSAQSAELASALAKEKEIVEQQKTFVSMVSHEFRTPLTIIDGNAQIIQRRGPSLTPEQLQTRAVTIRSAVERLVRLIETILSNHMLESGMLTVNPRPCDLARIIAAAAKDQQEISPQHKIQLNLRDLPEVMRLDEKVMHQMMSNLLSNAVKYSPSEPLVDVNAFRNGAHVVIEVVDRGVGIPENEMSRIFSKYFRASTSGGIPGSGLGLSLVKQFVELHHGTIDLRSKVGAGTVVTVTLPLM